MRFEWIGGVCAIVLIVVACAGHHPPPGKVPLKEQVIENAPDSTPTPTPNSPISRPLDPVGRP
jgi:hypothetical protein